MEESNCERQRIAQCPVSSHLMMMMDISVWIGEIETLPEVKVGNCERAKVLAPRSRARRDDSGCLIPHPSIHHSSHPLAHSHSHDNHQRISASSTTSTARQRQTKSSLGDTHNLARLTPNTAKSIHRPRGRCHSHNTRSPHHQNTCSNPLILPGPYLHRKAISGVEHIRLGRHSPLHADNCARAL
jgi:hypothetical protein